MNQRFTALSLAFLSLLVSSCSSLEQTSVTDSKQHSDVVLVPDSSSLPTTEHSAFAFPEDLLLTDDTLYDFAKQRLAEGKLIYVYGKRLSHSRLQDYFPEDTSSRMWYHFNRSTYFTQPEIKGEDIQVVSGFDYGKEIQNWTSCIISCDGDMSESDYAEVIQNDFNHQSSNRNPALKYSFEAVRSNSTNIYSYDTHNFSNYLVAGFILYQDMGEKDPQQNYFGLTTTITPRSKNGSSLCTQANIQYTLMNSNAIMSDYAPDKTDFTLDIGTSVGTSGVDLSFGTTLHSTPTINSAFYPDLNAAAVQWNSSLDSLNDIGLKSGVSWHCNTTNPSADVTFYAYFPAKTSVKTFTVYCSVEDVK